MPRTGCYFVFMYGGTIENTLTTVAELERVLSPTYSGDIRRDSAHLRATSARLLLRATALRLKSTDLCARPDPLDVVRRQAACFASPTNADRTDTNLQWT